MKKLDYKVAIIEGNRLLGNILCWKLSKELNCKAELFTTGEDFFNQKEYSPDLVLLDYELNGRASYASDGVELMNHFNDIPVIVMSGQQNIQIAIDFIRKGVCDYVVKDKDIDETIVKSVQTILAQKEENEKLAQLNKSRSIDLRRMGFLLLCCVIIGVGYHVFN